MFKQIMASMALFWTIFKNIYSEFEDAFCTPAQYTPPTKVPANLTGARKQASLLLPGYSPSYVTADSTLVHPR